MGDHLEILALVWTVQAAFALILSAVVAGWYFKNYVTARAGNLQAVATLWLMALGSICGIAGAHGLFFGVGVLSLILEPTDETRIFWSRVLIIVSQAVLMAVTLWKFVMTVRLDRTLTEEGGE